MRTGPLQSWNTWNACWTGSRQVADTPEDWRAAAWQAMARGVADKRHPARNPTLATCGADGPQARTVVLRGWDDGVAEMHTDTASGKIADLNTNPRAALHVWIPKAKLQIRLKGPVTIHEADAETWARVPEGARRVYGGTPAPGEPLTAPEDHDPAPDIAQFAVLRLAVARADILHLGAERHLRVRAIRGAAGWESVWVAP